MSPEADSSITFVGMPGEKLTYGCVAETLLNVFAGLRRCERNMGLLFAIKMLRLSRFGASSTSYERPDLLQDLVVQFEVAEGKSVPAPVSGPTTIKNAILDLAPH